MDSLVKEKQLYNACKLGDVESLNKLLREDEFVLEYYGSSTGFCCNGTPLHEAATRGHVNFAKVLLQSKPDLVTEVDSRLRSPLHLASANGRLEMVKLLVKANSDVCLMEDELGSTPLHLAAMVNAGVEVVDELIRAKPESIMYPSNKTKTVAIIHSYVLRRGPEALQPVVEVDPTFLNSQDGEGNTLLHKVVAMKKCEMLKYMISKFQSLDINLNLKNQNSLTVVDLIDQMPRDSKSEELQKSISGISKIDYVNRDNNEGWFENKRNAILVAATVIASMAYQAGLNPPGGVWDDKDTTYYSDNYKDNITMIAGTSMIAAIHPKFYNYFWALNTASFIGALSIVVLLIHGSPRKVRTTMFRVFLQNIYMFLISCVLWVTATTMALSYAAAVYTITPDSEGFDWKNIEDIVVAAILSWLGLVCLVIFVNICRFFICVGVKLVKCIKRRSRWSVSQSDQPRRHPNYTTSTCCLPV